MVLILSLLTQLVFTSFYSNIQTYLENFQVVKLLVLSWINTHLWKLLTVATHYKHHEIRIP